MIETAAMAAAEATLAALIFLGGTYLVYLAGKAVRMAYRAIHKN